MKARLIYIQSNREAWFQEALNLYLKKINGFVSFEIKALKAKGLDRSNFEEKKQKESDFLLKQLSAKDQVILFDEKGRRMSSSMEFSNQLIRCLESGKQNITFIIGGAYGVSDDLKQRADICISLSSLTMNHLVATVVSLEQIYRGFTIIKGIPYHNS